MSNDIGEHRRHRRCNAEEHEGPRYLAVSEFHKQGKRNGKIQYRGVCKRCYNARMKIKYYSQKRNNAWELKYKRGYVRARSRALTRLSKMAPELFEQVLVEELKAEGVPHNGPMRKRLRELQND